MLFTSLGRCARNPAAFQGTHQLSTGTIMKRISFITALFSISTLPLWWPPFLERVKKRTTTGFKVKRGEGRYHGPLKLRGVNSNILNVKISGKDTDGDLAIFEQTSLSQGRGTPLHVHYLQDEIFSILEGEYLFRVGEVKYEMSAGDIIFLPRNVPHAWTQKSLTGKMSVTVQPAGKLEDFFVFMAALDHDPSPEELNRIFEQNEMKVVGAPLTLD